MSVPSPLSSEFRTIRISTVLQGRSGVPPRLRWLHACHQAATPRRLQLRLTSNISSATMALQANDLSLQGLPYDVRLELFSHMILPPFDGCQEYAGLWLSCRQFYEEANLEGKRQLKKYADSVSRTPDNVDPEGIPVHSSGDEAADPNIEILIPHSLVYARPIIVVNVPFLLPPQEHDWQFQKPPPRMCGNGLRHLLAKPGPRRDAFNVAQNKRNECSRQQEMYRQRVIRLLGSIADLDNLYARLEIHIIARDDAANIVKGTKFNRRLDSAERLESLVLGKMLKTYLDCIRSESWVRMQRWSQGRAFHVTQIDVTWNFGTTDPTAHRVQDPWGSFGCIPTPTNSRARAEYTADRREGFGHISFDIKAFLQLQLKGADRQA